jgi:signal transduction histidine kinase
MVMSAQAVLMDEYHATVLAKAVELARRLVGSQRASLMLAPEGTDELQIIAASGVPSGVIAGSRVCQGDSIAGSVARTRQPILRNGPQDIHEAWSSRYRSGSFISVPVPLHDGRCGVLSVADPLDGESFEADELLALQDLAAYVARDLEDLPAEERIRGFHETVRQLQRRVIQAQEDERQRLARELHDEASHALTRTIFRLDFQALKLAKEEAPARAVLEEAREQLVACAGTLHGLAFALRPRILTDLGLSAALRSLVAQHNADGAVPITLIISGWERRFGEETELAIFRVVQEALTNVRKHAQATEAAVSLHFRPRELRLTVEDNGIGLARRGKTPRSRIGQGVRGMRERVEALDGSFALTGRKGRTRVAVTLPLEGRNASS